MTAVQVRRTNHLSDWQEKDAADGMAMRRIGVPVMDAAE